MLVVKHAAFDVLASYPSAGAFNYWIHGGAAQIRQQFSKLFKENSQNLHYFTFQESKIVPNHQFSLIFGDFRSFSVIFNARS